MMRRFTGGLPVLAGTFAMFCARAAFAGDPSCTAMAIEADTAVRTRWPGLLDHVREALGGRDDVDPCSTVALTLRDGAIGVEVALPDGRSARRSVPRSEDVVPTLEALLIVPEASRAPAGSSTPPASPASAPSTASETRPPDARPSRTASTPVPPREASAFMPLQRPSHLRIELSAATGVRVGDGQAGVGIGVLSFLDLSGWLLGFSGRLDRYRVLAGADSSGALELALLGGRRVWFRTMALDLAAGPAVALGGTTTYSSQSNGNDVSASATNTVPRLLLEVRLAFSALSTVHPFVGLDGDFGPARSPDAGQLNAPRLPVWTLGLALGATVGTP
jgi:hypothetical protein